MNFTETDRIQIRKKGLTTDKVNEQLETFKDGLPYTRLRAAATLDDGILKLNSELIEQYKTYFEEKLDSISVTKFVPASGAATRMFKFLFRFINDYDPAQQSLNAFINKNKLKDLYTFTVGLEKFPFYDMVMDHLKSKEDDFSTLSNDEQIFLFVKSMLDPDGFNFGDSPKGLLPFHNYKNSVSTAFEEHLYETALYTSSNHPSHLHFTISEKYQDRFNDEFKRIEEQVEQITGTNFEVTFSYQHEATDTIAVDLKNNPFREDDGSLHFRPSGHGALLTNLNQLDADVVIIKNIDNVVVKKYKEEVALYKKVLGGILLKTQEQTFKYLNVIDSETYNENDIEAIEMFLKENLNVVIAKDYHKYSDQSKVEYLKENLNKPIRVCGMVKNEGEPGGGPFWIENDHGVSLQIVESAQVNKKNEKQ
ncbi:MAG: DUF4301 family protein, partial [Winogradskyella sp.]|nr:DUF4301 family protein [Winogradskyella sp.]